MLEAERCGAALCWLPVCFQRIGKGSGDYIWETQGSFCVEYCDEKMGVAGGEESTSASWVRHARESPMLR